MKRKPRGRPRLFDSCVIKTSIAISENDDAYLLKVILRESRKFMKLGIPRASWPTRSSIVRRLIKEARQREDVGAKTTDIICGGEGTLPDELQDAYDHVKEQGVTKEAMRYPAGELLYLFVISDLLEAKNRKREGDDDE